MGLEDRDWYREAVKSKAGGRSNGRAPSRRVSLGPYTVSGVIFVALIGLFLYGKRLAISQPMPPSPVEQRPQAPQANDLRPAEAAPSSGPPTTLRPAAPPVAFPTRESTAPPASREIYHCKAYGGGTFWSSAICSEHRATIDRIVTVPASLPWEQQVAIAQSQRQAAEALYAPATAPATSPAATPAGALQTSGECVWLEQQIRAIDSAARQPQSAVVQDRLRQDRQAVRSRQTALRC